MLRRVLSVSARVAVSVGLFGAAVGLLGSCGAQQVVRLSPDGSGTVNFSYTVSPVILDSVDQFAAFLEEDDPLADGELFDLDEIRADFEENPALSLQELGTPQPNVLQGTFQFSDVEEVFQEEEELQQAGIVSLRNSGGTYTLDLRLNRDNFADISALFPALENPLMDMFGPLANEGVSESEYIEMMQFAFDSAVVPAIQQSVIEARVVVDGAIVDQRGGTVTGNQVVFRIPLIRILLLDQELSYSLSFRP